MLRLLAAGPKLLVRRAGVRSSLLVRSQLQFERHFAKATKEDHDSVFNEEEAEDFMRVTENQMGDLEDERVDEDFEALNKLYMKKASPDDEMERDRAEALQELKVLQEDLNNKDKVLSEEWVLNPANDIYYNTMTQETKVPFEKSWKEYQKRRAKRGRNEFVEAENNSFPDYISPIEYRRTGQFYSENEMDIVRKKYDWLDFKELGKALDEADSRYFQAPPDRNIIRWGPNLAPPKHMKFDQEDYEAENLKFLGMLPFKFHIATMRCIHGTSTGKKHSYGALVVGGNGNGFAGYGYGKGLTPMDATRRAAHELRKNLTDIPLDEDRTICQNRTGKHGKTLVIMKRCLRGHGQVAGPIMQAICNSIGIKDISTKVTGSQGRNPLHVVYAAFKGLVTTRSPRNLALDRGFNYYKYVDAMVREPPPTQAQLLHRIETIRGHVLTASQEWRRRSDISSKILPEGKAMGSDEDVWELMLKQFDDGEGTDPLGRVTKGKEGEDGDGELEGEKA